MPRGAWKTGLRNFVVKCDPKLQSTSSETTLSTTSQRYAWNKLTRNVHAPAAHMAEKSQFQLKVDIVIIRLDIVTWRATAVECRYMSYSLDL